MDLKKESRLLIKLSPSLGSINQVITSECQEWFFGERSLLPSVGDCRLCVGKPSVVLGRLIWKWWFEEHFRCLVEAIKRIDQEKQATPKRELVIIFLVVFSQIVLSCKQRWIKEASQPQLESALDHYRFFKSYGWRMDSIYDDWFLSSYKLDFTLLLE
jgi:hypothetical protein